MLQTTWSFTDPTIEEELTSDAAVDWSEQDIVLLHWVLLLEVRALADPATPLDQKLDTLRWVFTEPAKDACAFSFASCLQVIGCSPLSPIEYCGRLDVEAVRDHLRARIRPWLTATLKHHPSWVRDALHSHPEWVAAQLARDPRAIARQLHQLQVQGDLFA